ncbi:MAG TPA: TolC family protein, partial [Pyrinomonadaceae bacterium]|nr:TolC family protein [Pyrinomonadaceae bacterium]
MNRRKLNPAIMALTLALLFCASGRQASVFAQSQTQQAGAPVTSIPTTDSLPSGNQTIPAPTPQPQSIPEPSPVQTIAPAPSPTPTRPQSVTVPQPTPEELPIVPAIAPNYRAPERPLPEIGRIGVDMTDQRPLSLREALEMALSNNKDIEVSRQNVRAAEFDLLGARGAYDPRFSSASYYERTATPSASFLSGSSSGAVTQSDFTGTARFEGLAPKFGGSYRADFSAIRLTTDNQFAALNPQYPTALTFSYTQPLLRGLRFDNTRR